MPPLYCDNLPLLWHRHAAYNTSFSLSSSARNLRPIIEIKSATRFIKHRRTITTPTTMTTMETKRRQTRQPIKARRETEESEKNNCTENHNWDNRTGKVRYTWRTFAVGSDACQMKRSTILWVYQMHRAACLTITRQIYFCGFFRRKKRKENTIKLISHRFCSTDFNG